MEHRYDILELLGRGAFGTTYLGKNKITGHNVVIKTEPKNVEISTIQHESKILIYLRSCGGSARIPSVCWYGVEGSYRCLVMDYYPISTEFITTNSTEYEKWEISLKLFETLKYIHDHKIIHRDIKPQNIVFRSDKKTIEPYLIDFGLAKVVETSIRIQNRVSSVNLVGSPKYMSLFIHEGHEAIPQDDYISAATVLLYLFEYKQTWVYKINQSIEEIEEEKRTFLKNITDTANSTEIRPLEDLFLYFYLWGENVEYEHIHKICISARISARQNSK